MKEDQFTDIIHNDKVIRGFFGEYRWLSNYHNVPIIVDGLVYGSTEAAYQALKCDNRQVREAFTLYTPAEAKKAGKTVVLRPGWEDMKKTIMFELNFQKFYYNEELGKKLLATRDREIIESNWWKDTYWGVCGGEGENWLGITLMSVRSVLSDSCWEKTNYWM